ncbi:hypothetical protein G9F72_011455 [Clostridium estertheticum]|uniref:hypothetical protein n=1 Tax=Clostridium estertheticum TaxID=238834 RepID=UPI0013E8FAD6|nr:hypothetical protein [Clostridium estertheticum]MBZ9686942.1 hypothetical protein [Clostridium estertheticum]
MKYENKFKFIGRIGIVVYLLGTWITSFFYMTDGPSSPLYYKNVSTLLNTLFIISIITSIFISKTNHRYTVCFILMMLSSIFFVLWLNPAYGSLNPWHGDVIKVGIYSLISNVILIISIIYSYKKYKKVNVM